MKNKNSNFSQNNEAIQIRKIVEQVVEELKLKSGLFNEANYKDLKSEYSDKLLTRKEAAQMLKVDMSTIHNWTKRNILTSYGIGGRVYYKESEIKNALIKLNEK